MIFDVKMLDGGLTEDEHKFFKVIARHTKSSGTVDFNVTVGSDEEQLRQEAEREGINTQQFKGLLGKMEELKVIKCTRSMGKCRVEIYPLGVKTVQDEIPLVTCKRCKWPSLRKTNNKMRCRICGKEYDNED